MWTYVLALVVFGAGYAFGRVQRENEQRSARQEENALPDSELKLNRQIQFGHLAPSILQLHAQAGQKLDTSEMDGLMGFDDLASEETKRSRRARLVSELNAWSWSQFNRPILTRERDEDDRRRMVYVVAAFDVPSWVSNERQSNVS